MKNNKKGFTLAELLIVVAIIAVLVAIAIPVFNTQLEKSREGVDLANIRSCYAEAALLVINGKNVAAADGQLSAVTGGAITATKSATNTWEITIAGFKPHQTDNSSWLIDASDVASCDISGLSISTASSPVTLKFEIDATGKLSDVTV